MILTIKHPNGHAVNINCEALLQVDGKDYNPSATDPLDDLAERVTFLEGQMHSVLEIFTRREEASIGADDDSIPPG